MYRLADFENRLVQKVVSKELFYAFQYVFAFDKSDMLPDSEMVRSFLQYSYEEDIILQRSIDEFTLKIQKMIQELIDVNNEYTFDLVGENVLFKVLCLINHDFEGIRKWKVKSSPEDIEAIKIVAKEILADAEMLDLENDQVNILAKRMYYVPSMLHEIDGEDGLDFENSLLFWDLDFSFVDDWSPSDLQKFINRFGGMRGLVEVCDDREEYSGSLKYPLENNYDPLIQFDKDVVQKMPKYIVLSY